MSVRSFVCLVLITKIVASDYQSTLQYESAYKYNIHNYRNTRKLITESLNDSPSGTEQTMNTTDNKTNGTENMMVVVPLKQGEDKNGTVTKKPDENKEGLETQSSQIVNLYPPYVSYEVTENVIDIPDDRTPAGPIVTNFTHRPPPLNLAKPTNKTSTDKTTESSIQTKKNRLSILHINAEFDDKEHEKPGHKVVGLLKGIREYVNCFQRGIVNGFHSFFHKHHHDHEHGERFVRAVYNEDNSGKINGDQNLDKTDIHNVHRRHINMT